MVTWLMAIPFAVLLIAIAVVPLIPVAHQWWEKTSNQLVVSLVLGITVSIDMVLAGQSAAVIGSLIEYAQFILLLFGLFVVAGGIALTGDLAGTPKVNTLFLAVGALLSSCIGTTGAAMLMIRPLLISNGHRKHRVHTVVFSIFIMANCGGLLTPLGDPPLFLGLLRGVPFTWTLSLWPEWLLVNALSLVTFYCIDRRFAAEEDMSRDIVEPLKIVGKLQVVWFAAIILAVAVVPSIDPSALNHPGAAWWTLVPWREMIILTAAGLSWATSEKRARFEVNQFTFAPIKEVAVLFIGIFLTMVPALILLDKYAGELPLNPVWLHLMTGGLSSFLDNAPTYASFFEVAHSSAATMPGVPMVAGVAEPYLIAISTGAVFFGAMTYIGNGPNFMVRSVAAHQGVAMPSFLGYIGWSLRWLAPILICSMMIFLAQSRWTTPVGIALALFIVVRAVLIARGTDWIRLPGMSR